MKRLTVVILFILIVACGLGASCRPTSALLTQQVEARRLASELHVQFTKAAEASNRAVMADTDEASTAAADEARGARQIVERNLETLGRQLTTLGYAGDARVLDEVKGRYEEYRRVDDEVLPLSVENTNLKAQRLSFGDGERAAVRFRQLIDVPSQTAKTSCCGQAIALRARSAVLEVQVLQAPHIAASEDGEMTRIEMQMSSSEEQARKALAELKSAGEIDTTHLDEATAALDAFMKINGEIVALSRRNTNVRSLALALGRKRTVTAECEEQLQRLEEALGRHQFSATR